MNKLLLYSVCLLLANESFSQKNDTPILLETKVEVLNPIEFKVTQSPNLLLSNTQPVFDQKVETAREQSEREHRKPQQFVHSVSDGVQYGNDPTTIQTSMGARTPLAVISRFSGLTSGSQPLDPTGSVGTTLYVQSINSTPLAAYNKTTGTAVYNGSIGQITGTGTSGDPVVIYDKFADRWCVAQLDGSTGFAFAVSKTNDPAGAWSAYKYNSGKLPDYIKFGVWSDGYYMTANNGGTMFIMERDQMIAGNSSARIIKATYKIPTNAGNGFWLPLPGDADGLIPPAGMRCPLFGFTDNAWGGSEIDGVKVWSVGVTWGTSPTADVTLDATIPTASFDASYNSSWNDITQPGSQMLDGLGGVCMYRSQWNSFVGTNRVALNWGVKISSTQRSIKWVELRQDQSTKQWSLYQEGIYTPDASNRWLGSIAMDCNGDIALCYAKTSSSIPMCLAYTGRLASDPLGNMTFAETVVFLGTGSIPSTNRIGDYAQTSLDPDGNTFWHTGTYSNNKRVTGIYSFQLAPCATGIDAEKAKESEFVVNQTGQTLFVKANNLPSNNPQMLQLFDISGKMISEKSVTVNLNSMETTVDVSGLNSGMYLLRVGTGDFQRVKKIVLK